MTALQAIFLFNAALTVLAALMVVTRRNLVHAALFLVVALFGVAVVFVLLEAPFLAVIQVLVYIGAIAILMIFAVMLTRRVTAEYGQPTNRYFWLAALAAVLVLEGLVVAIGAWPGFRSQAPSLPEGVDSIGQLGAALVSPNAYVIPFEVASVMLLAALIGALVVAWQRNR